MTARRLALTCLTSLVAATACRSRDNAAGTLGGGSTVLNAGSGATTYRTPGVTITTDGNGNDRIATAAGTVDATSDGVQVTSIPGPAGGMNHVVTVTADGVHRTFACDSGGANVGSNNNVLTFTGTCQIVNVLGNDNVLTVAASEVIQASGNNNAIRYAAGVGGKDPIIVNRGSNNTIAHGQR